MKREQNINMQHKTQGETCKVRRRRRRTFTKLIVINFNFCQISARIKEYKKEKGFFFFFLQKDLTQLEINPDK